MKRNRFWIKFIFYSYVAFFWLVVTLIGLELYFRLSGQFMVNQFVHDPVLGWTMHKGRVSPGKVLDKDEPFPTYFNSMGFRGAEVVPQQPANTLRILVLGDSYTAGLDHSDEVIFTNILQANLQAALPQRKVEVINMAVPAWGTDQLYLALTHHGFALQPDHVLVMMAPNDIREAYAKQFFTLEADKLVQHELPGLSWRRSVYWDWSTKYHVFQFIQQKWWHTNFGKMKEIIWYYPCYFKMDGVFNYNTKLPFAHELHPEFKKAYQLNEALLSAMADSCSKRKIGFQLSIIPTKTEFEAMDTLQYQPGKVAAYLHRLHENWEVPFVNLYDSLLKQEPEPLSIFRQDEYHLNQKGHAFAGTQLAQYFLGVIME